MSTNTNAPATETQADAKAKHLENVQFAKDNNLPSVGIIGNTFPVKGLLFVLGGKWDKEQKVWMVPQHNAAAAQAAADKFTPGTDAYAKAQEEKAKERAAKQVAKPAPAPKAQPAKPVAAPAPAKPATPASNLAIRVSAMADVMENVLKQLPEGAAANLFAEAVAKVREAGATL